MADLETNYNVKTEQGKQAEDHLEQTDFTGITFDEDSQAKLNAITNARDGDESLMTTEAKQAQAELAKEFINSLDDTEFVDALFKLFNRENYNTFTDMYNAGPLYSIFVQQLIVRAGGASLLEDNGKVDSFYGETTRQAVSLFQNSIGITDKDGKLGLGSLDTFKTWWETTGNPEKFSTLLNQKTLADAPYQPSEGGSAERVERKVTEKILQTSTDGNTQWVKIGDNLELRIKDSETGSISTSRTYSANMESSLTFNPETGDITSTFTGEGSITINYPRPKGTGYSGSIFSLG